MTKQTNKTIDLAAIRERLANTSGPYYWRSLEEVAETEEFQTFLENEFPGGIEPGSSSVSRRTFLKLMGASMALAGLTACGPLQPEERIIPYVVPPPEHTPGVPLFFASTIPIGGYGRGVVVESHEGRPTNISGNPLHPGSLGSVDLFTAASILTMYDPDRSRQIMNLGAPSDWEAFVNTVIPQIPDDGSGLAILTEPVTSPTLYDQIEQLREQYPEVQWFQYEPISRDSVTAGARMAFDEDVEVHYHFDKADVVLALDSDFLSYGPAVIPNSRAFAEKRRVREDNLEINRLYAVESTPSITGSMADHRLPIQSNQVEDFARMVASRLGVNLSGDVFEIGGTWVDALVEDLQAHEGAGIVIAGVTQPPAVHALAHAINDALGNLGETITFTDPVEAEPVEKLQSIDQLVKQIGAGNVDILIIIGGNPVYDSPADIDFAGLLGRVAHSVHMSLYQDETSSFCGWHIPLAHFLETWGDARAYDGTASIIQPLIAPLYGGKTAYEMLAALMGEPDASGYDVVRAYWDEHLPDETQKKWELILQEGVIEGTAFEPKTVTLNGNAIERTPWSGTGFEVIYRPDPTIWDGSFANNGWLQETPKPLSKITWENVALISPFTAQEYGFNTGDLVDLSYNTMALRLPVWVLPGQADNSVTIHLGYGRTMAGQVGTNIGQNAYTFRTLAQPWFSYDLGIANTGMTHQIASTQYHHSVKVTHPRLYEYMQSRTHELVRVGTIAQFRDNPEFAHMKGDDGELKSIYPPFETAGGAPWKGHKWGMVVDLNVCTGCNACVTACQSENNIPIVGKEEVIRGREMHWIRIDRYYDGNLANPNTYHQPLGCVQCERAPCEVVCPVAATSHSLEGLNDMTYNRCVGTRYCSNNCPYKVRRFNFFEYADTETPSLKLMRNPNVTVRTRGVMEKCSYCVQRINAARIIEKREGEQIQDGDILTACQAACPTQAITFGDIADTNSHVAELRSQPHNYSLLGELNTIPRTTYLARLRNPNPAIEPPAEGTTQDGGH